MVKSKWGLALAAVVTVLSSLLMSVGMCTLFGLTPTLNGGYKCRLSHLEKSPTRFCLCVYRILFKGLELCYSLPFPVIIM